MVDIIKGNGKIIQCMVKDNLFGPMAKNLLVLTKTMPNMEKVNLVFPKVLLLKDNG